MDKMKTYFMAWESNEKQGYCMHEFIEDVSPRKAMVRMMEFVEADMPDVKGQLRANQFNRVD